jgi:hypothetical protein
MYYLELLRALEGTLSRWSRLHLQSSARAPISKKVDVRQAAGRKIIAESLSHDKKHVVPTSLSGIRVRRRRYFTRTTHLLIYNVFGTYPIKPKPTHHKQCI